jgi:hypothetical protein
VESGDWRIDVVEGALRRAHVVQYLEVEFVSVSKIASMIEREMSWLGSAKKYIGGASRLWVWFVGTKVSTSPSLTSTCFTSSSL